MAPILPSSPPGTPPGHPDGARLGRARAHAGARRPLRGPGRLAVGVGDEQVRAQPPAVEEDLAIAEPAAGRGQARQRARRSEGRRPHRVPPSTAAVRPWRSHGRREYAPAGGPGADGGSAPGPTCTLTPPPSRE